MRKDSTKIGTNENKQTREREMETWAKKKVHSRWKSDIHTPMWTTHYKDAKKN